jgi:putative membrane protein
MMDHMMGNMMFYGLGGLLMAIFWAVVFVGGGYLIYTFLQNKEKNTENKAEEILRERFARGEMTKEEFQEKIKYFRNE